MTLPEPETTAAMEAVDEARDETIRRRARLQKTEGDGHHATTGRNEMSNGFTGILEHPERVQPFTIWHGGFVIGFTERREAAEAWLAQESARLALMMPRPRKPRSTKAAD